MATPANPPKKTDQEVTKETFFVWSNDFMSVARVHQRGH